MLKLALAKQPRGETEDKSLLGKERLDWRRFKMVWNIMKDKCCLLTIEQAGWVYGWELGLAAQWPSHHCADSGCKWHHQHGTTMLASQIMWLHFRSWNENIPVCCARLHLDTPTDDVPIQHRAKMIANDQAHGQSQKLCYLTMKLGCLLPREQLWPGPSSERWDVVKCNCNHFQEIKQQKLKDYTHNCFDRSLPAICQQ